MRCALAGCRWQPAWLPCGLTAHGEEFKNPPQATASLLFVHIDAPPRPCLIGNFPALRCPHSRPRMKIHWSCVANCFHRLDWAFLTNCLPRYIPVGSVQFRIHPMYSAYTRGFFVSCHCNPAVLLDDPEADTCIRPSRPAPIDAGRRCAIGPACRQCLIDGFDPGTSCTNCAAKCRIGHCAAAGTTLARNV